MAASDIVNKQSSGMATPETTEQPELLPGGLWQCQICRSVRTSQRAVFSVSQGGTIQRIICDTCGTVGHYDAPSREGVTPMMTHNRKFLVVDAARIPTPGLSRTTAPSRSSP